MTKPKNFSSIIRGVRIKRESQEKSKIKQTKIKYHLHGQQYQSDCPYFNGTKTIDIYETWTVCAQPWFVHVLIEENQGHQRKIDCVYFDGRNS